MDEIRQQLLKRYKAACKRAGVEELKIQHKFICCGKSSCSVCGGVEYAHGPYNYGRYVDTKTKKRRWVYIGRVPPRAAVDKNPGRMVDKKGSP